MSNVKNLENIIYLKRELKEISELLDCMLSSSYKTKAEMVGVIKVKHFFSGESEKEVYSYKLTYSQKSAMYRFFRTEEEDLRNRLKYFSKEDLELADAYINRKYE